MTYNVEVLIHINVEIQVEADNETDAFKTAQAIARAETIGRGFDPDDITLIEGNALL